MRCLRVSNFAMDCSDCLLLPLQHTKLNLMSHHTQCDPSVLTDIAKEKDLTFVQRLIAGFHCAQKSEHKCHNTNFITDSCMMACV